MDLEPTLKRIKPLLDPERFAEVFVDHGTLCWPGDLDLAPETLYAEAHGLPVPTSFEDVAQNELTRSRGTADLSGEVAKRKRWAPLRDEKVFAKAKVDGGTVAWPGDFDLAPERLYALAHQLPPPKTEADDRANIATVTLRQIRELAGQASRARTTRFFPMYR